MNTTNESVHMLTRWAEIFMKHSMQNFLQFARTHGLTREQMMVLFHISRKGCASVSEVGGVMDMTNPSASQLLDRMVQQGLVNRSEDPNDRRLKQITLSGQGQALLEEGLQRREKWLAEMVERMTAEEQAQVGGALEILLRKAQEMEDRPAGNSGL